MTEKVAAMNYELEDELELEDEFELEDELESEWEDEFEDELEGEFEDEWEDEYEDEFEDEQFFGALASIAGKVLPALSGGLFEGEDEYEQLSPQQAGLLMEYAAERAAESESEDEAEAFLGALIPLAMKALPMIASAAPSVIKTGMSLFRKAAPQVIRAATSVGKQLLPHVKRTGRQLWRNPQTRKLIRTLPATIRRTTQQLVQPTRPGYRPRRRPAGPVWQRNMANTLASRRRRQALLRRHQMLINRQGGFPNPCRRRRRRRVLQQNPYARPQYWRGY